MKQYVGVMIGVLLLAGCGPKPGTTNPTVEAFVTSFAKDYQQASKDFGVAMVNETTSVNTTDCMVFEQASQQPMPTTLGRLTAWEQSLRYRLLLGCAPNISTGMAQYESARRQLNAMYQQFLRSKTQSEQSLLAQTKEAKFITNQSQEVANEVLACRSVFAMDKRVSTKAVVRLNSSERACQPRPMSAYNRGLFCDYGLMNAQAHSMAQGPRDDLSYLSDIVSRYRSMWLSCTPDAATSYQSFHNTVPRTLFEGPAMRFRFSIDPLMQCTLNKTALQRSKGRQVQPVSDYLECGAEMNVQNLYNIYLMPTMFSVAMLKQEGPLGDWLFNPKDATKNPQRWQLNACQTNTAALLVQRGMNLVQPEALGEYCRDEERRVRREQRKNR